MSKQNTWDIIRYAPGSGTACYEDAAAFDVWYTDRAVAAAVMQDRIN